MLAPPQLRTTPSKRRIRKVGQILDPIILILLSLFYYPYPIRILRLTRRELVTLRKLEETRAWLKQLASFSPVTISRRRSTLECVIRVQWTFLLKQSLKSTRQSKFGLQVQT